MKNAAMHGAAAALRSVEAGTEPFEIGRVAAIDLDIEESGRRDLQGVLGLVLDGLCEFFRSNLAEREVHAGKVLAIQRVKFSVVGRAVLGAKPPAPVAAFRGEKRFVCFFQAGFRWGVAAPLRVCFGSSPISLARVPKQFPCGNIFGVTDPDLKIGVDSGGGEVSADSRNFLGGGDGSVGGQRAEILIILNTFVKFAQEFAAVAGVIFPGIFAVEKQADGQRLLARDAFAEKTQTSVQVGGSGFAVHAAVDEADQVREMVVAK